MNMTLEFCDFCLQKGGFRLNHISFGVERQEIFAILGKTGAGKTLLLESAAGFYAPESGRVLLDGRDVREIPLTERGIGFVYQDYALFPHMTVEKNIGYSLQFRHAPDRKRRILDLAELLGIRGILPQYPQTLSGGERQRCALARALAPQPSLLLMDEPFSALDPATRKALYREICEIPGRFDCAVLFVTHDFHEAQLLARRIGVMSRGRLACVRRAEELFLPGGEADAEVDAFLTDCPGNGSAAQRIKGELHDGTGTFSAS